MEHMDHISDLYSSTLVSVPDESDDLARLADDEYVLEPGEEEREEEGHDGQHVHQVHGALEEPPLAGRAH